MEISLSYQGHLAALQRGAWVQQEGKDCLFVDLLILPWGLGKGLGLFQ